MHKKGLKDLKTAQNQLQEKYFDGNDGSQNELIYKLLGIVVKDDYTIDPMRPHSIKKY